MLPRPPISTLFPYTTLFRSALSRLIVLADNYDKFLERLIAAAASLRIGPAETPGTVIGVSAGPIRSRSEEHTSELQSPVQLVCRLLLEKKKTQTWVCPIVRY